MIQKHPYDLPVRGRYLPIFPSAAHPDNGILLRLQREGTQLRKKSYIKTEPQYVVDVALLVPYDAADSGRTYKLNPDSYTVLVRCIQRRDSGSRRHSEREDRALQYRHRPQQYIEPTHPSSFDPPIPHHRPVQRFYHTPPRQISSIGTWAQYTSRAEAFDPDEYDILVRERLERRQLYAPALSESEPEPGRPTTSNILKYLILGGVMYGSYWAWPLVRKQILKTCKDFRKALPGEGSPRALFNLIARSSFMVSLNPLLTDHVKPFLAESFRVFKVSILPFLQRSAILVKSFVVSSTRESVLPFLDESAHAFENSAVPFVKDSATSLLNAFDHLTRWLTQVLLTDS